MLTVILVMLSALPGGISVVVYIFRTQDVLTLVYGGLIQLLLVLHCSWAAWHGAVTATTKSAPRCWSV